MTQQLSSAEKKQIKGLMKSDGWDAVMRFVALKIDQWKGETITGTSAYEELKALHTRDGKVEGVNEVFEQLERQAFE